MLRAAHHQPDEEVQLASPRFLVRLGKVVQGPFESWKLRRLAGFQLATSVCVEGDKNWAPAYQLINLEEYFSGTPSSRKTSNAKTDPTVPNSSHVQALLELDSLIETPADNAPSIVEESSNIAPELLDALFSEDVHHSMPVAPVAPRPSFTPIASASAAPMAPPVISRMPSPPELWQTKPAPSSSTYVAPLITDSNDVPPLSEAMDQFYTSMTTSPIVMFSIGLMIGLLVMGGVWMMIGRSHPSQRHAVESVRAERTEPVEHRPVQFAQVQDPAALPVPPVTAVIEHKAEAMHSPIVKLAKSPARPTPALAPSKSHHPHKHKTH